MMAQQGFAGKAGYGMALATLMTSVGALSEQLTQVVKGRDPLDMSEESFWLKAAARGGAGGLVADLVFQDHNRFGGGIWDGLLGPVAGQIDDVFGLTLGNIQELAEGEDTNFGREVSRFVEQNTPGRTLWYTRLMLERYGFDNLDRWLDPKANEAFRATERRARTEHGQSYFSRPGSGSIGQRAPDADAALGQ